MKVKFGVKQIVLAVVAVVLIAVMIAGNIVLNYFSPLLHGFFGGYRNNGTGNVETGSPIEIANRVVQSVAEDSMVLLKNEEVDGKPYLPRPETTKFNLFGWGSTDHGFLLVGAGSGGTNITADKVFRTTLTEAFEKANVAYNEDLIAEYNKFSTFDADYRSGGSTGKDVTESIKNPAATWYTDAIMNQAESYSKDAVVVLSRWGAENGGGGELKNIGSYSNGTYLELTANEKAMFEKLQAKGFNVTVLLNTTNPIELDFLETYDCIKACMFVGIPGQSGATAIPNLLVGSKLVDELDEDGNVVNTSEVKISPSGRLSDTYAYSWQEHNPTYPNVGRTGDITYQEGIYFGYKWYETADAAKNSDGKNYYEQQGTTYDKVVQFPFGYGLSYTSFTQEIAETSWTDNAQLKPDETYTVTVHVKNTGEYPGKDVVQLYYTPPYIEGQIEKASVNLLAFAKTDVLEPGEETDIELTFTAYDMAAYDAYGLNDVNGTGYELDKGGYEIKLMANAHEYYGGAKSNKNSISFNLTNGFAIDNDPVTGTPVDNLFTGSNAYANMPIDGSTGVSMSFEYLSRKNGFANYSALKTVAGTTSAASNAAKYDYTGYDDKKEEVDGYQYEVDMGWRLVYLEDGGEARDEHLNPDASADPVQFTIDKELIEELHNYDSDVWTELLDQLSQRDIKLLIGFSGFQTVGLESIGKPRNTDKDGPAGFNNNVVDADTMTLFPIFPAETLSGCSWNTELMAEIGRAQGRVGVEQGVQGWYAPGVNLHRSPYNSRNYEYYSEDGVLSGYLAAATIAGAKEENVYCYLKHFVLAESGQNSNDWYTWTTEQTLREMYCKPFEIAVKVGGANAMMSAFNKVGAVWTGYNHALLTAMLREEWGFKGSVITDWGQSYMNEYGRAIKAGNNMWLRSQGGEASINFSNVGEAYAARKSAKDILYTYIDTLYTSGQETTTATAAPHSPLFVGLWVGVDVLLGLGLAACVVFFFWSPGKKKAEPAQAEQPAEPTEE